MICRRQLEEVHTKQNAHCFYRVTFLHRNVLAYVIHFQSLLSVVYLRMVIYIGMYYEVYVQAKNTSVNSINTAGALLIMSCVQATVFV